MNPLLKHTLTLKDFLPGDSNDGWASDDGEAARKRLIEKITRLSGVQIIYLSMKGIKNINASCSREAIVKTIIHYNSKIGICLTDIENPEYLENIFSPAARLEQPVFIKQGDQFDVIGPNRYNAPSKTNQPILHFVQSRGRATAVELAKNLNLKLTNASTKLKQLLEQGFILRVQGSDEGPGLEYFYYPIR